MRKVAVLAAVALLLAAYLLLADRGGDVNEGARERARLVSAFDRTTVQKIVISRAGAAPFSLERGGKSFSFIWSRLRSSSSEPSATSAAR